MAVKRGQAKMSIWREGVSMAWEREARKVSVRLRKREERISRVYRVVGLIRGVW